MLVRFIKAAPTADADLLTCVRPDGSTTSGEMARQGVLPHAAFHFVIETMFGWHDAFFGNIARGAPIEAVTAKLHGERSGAWTKITQAMQCEALIECPQEEQWSGGSDPFAFVEKLIATSRRRGVAPPDITAEELDRARVALREFGAAWRPLAPGAALERTFGT